MELFIHVEDSLLDEAAQGGAVGIVFFCRI